MLWYFIEDCFPRTSDRPLLQYFFLYILRTKTAVSVKQLHRFLKNLEVFYIQKVLIQTMGYPVKGNTDVSLKYVLLLSLCQTLYVIVIIGAKLKVATKFYRNIKQKSFLPKMLLKGFLFKLKYSFQGPIQTDEYYMLLLTLILV